MRRVVTSALIAALTAVAVPCAARAADDAASLMAKHAAFVGWHAGDGSVKTLRETGAVTVDRKPRAAISRLRLGAAYRNTYVAQNGVEFDDGFTGSVLWTSDTNGFTVREVGDIARAEFDRDALFGETTSTAAFAPAVLRNAKVDGVECTVVRLTSKVGFPVDVYVDPGTGAYRRAVIDPDGAYEASYDGLEYAAVDGKRFLSAWRSGTSSKVRSEFSKIEIDPPIVADELRPPKQTATWTFGAAPALLEYNADNGPRLFIDVTLNGVKGKFLFDTGAAGTSVIDSFARRAGAKRFGTDAIIGFGGESKANLFRVDSLTVGGSTLHNLVITSGLDEQDFERLGAVGLIGSDLLTATIADLNLDTKTLRLSDPATTEPNRASGMVVHVDLSDRLVHAPMRIDDRRDVMALLDSGSPSDIIFSRDLLKEKVGFTQLGTGSIYGIGGAEPAVCGKLKPVSMGPVRYDARYACAVESFRRNEILVGLDFMRAFNFVFDCPDGFIVMTPRKNY